MELGKIFKTRLYIRDIPDVHSYCVTCKNCKCLERGIATSTKKRFIKHLEEIGWFKVKGKWSCGSHGPLTEDRVVNWEWKIE